MPSPKNMKTELMVGLERKHRVAKLYLEGKAQWEIAELVKCAQGTVSKDLADVRAQWRESYKESFNDKVERELAKIDLVEEQAWQGWYKSCGDAVTRSKKTEKAIRKQRKEDEDDPSSGPVGEPMELVPIKVLVEMTRKGQAGNPAFLNEVRACIDMRLKVLGAYKEPPKDKPPVLIFNWGEMANPTPITDPVESAIAQLASGE